MDANSTNLSPDEMDWLARTMITEAPPGGREAIAHVVMNRLNSGNYPSSVKDILQQRTSNGRGPYQFESFNSPKWRGVSTSSNDYKNAIDAIQGITSGQSSDPTGGAIMFYSPTAQAYLNRPAPDWSVGRAPTTMIGGNAFYAPAGAKITQAAAQTNQVPDLLGSWGAKPTVQAPVANNQSSPPAQAAPQEAVPDLLGSWGAKPATAVPAASGANPSVPLAAPSGSSTVMFPTGSGYAPRVVENKISVPPPSPEPSAWDQTKSHLASTWDYITGQAAGVPGAIAGAWNQGTALNELGNQQIQQNNWRGIPNAALGMAAQVTAPLTGLIQKGVEEPVTEMTGNPDIGERAGIVSSFLAPSIAGRVAGRVGSAIGDATIGALDPETARLAQMARAQYGIPVNAGQMSPSPALRYGASAINRMPLSGGASEAANQQGAFNAAVSRTIGENADRLTPDVMNAARTRIGNALDHVAANTNIRMDNQFVGDLLNHLSQAEHEVSPAEFRPLNAIFDNLVDKFGTNGFIDGETYQAITRFKSSPLGRALNSYNSNISYWAGQIRNSLDDAMERSTPPDLVGELRQARGQYRNLMTLQPIVAKAPEGDISPSLLMGAVNKNTNNSLAFAQGGDLGNLARIGQRFLKEPSSSGTAERLSTINMLSRIGGLAGGAVGLNELGLIRPLSVEEMAIGAAGIPATLAAGRAAGSALRSNWLANSLINRSLNPPVSRFNPLAAAVGGAGYYAGQQPGQ